MLCILAALTHYQVGPSTVDEYTKCNGFAALCRVRADPCSQEAVGQTATMMNIRERHASRRQLLQVDFTANFTRNNNINCPSMKGAAGE